MVPSAVFVQQVSQALRVDLYVILSVSQAMEKCIASKRCLVKLLIALNNVVHLSRMDLLGVLVSSIYHA